MNIVLYMCFTTHLHKLHNQWTFVLSFNPHLHKFDLICKSCITMNIVPSFNRHLHKFDIVCTSWITTAFHSSFAQSCITNEYCTEFPPHLHKLHNKWILFNKWILYLEVHPQFARTCTNKCSSSTWLCNILIVSGFFPTVLQIFLLCKCFVKYQPATPQPPSF